MDTIPPGHRLIPISPVVNRDPVRIRLPLPTYHRPLRPMAAPPNLQAKRAARLVHMQAAIQAQYASLRAQLATFNKINATLPTHLRRRHDLVRLSLYADDSAQIAVPMAGRPPAPPPSPRVSRADLRDLARRNRVPIPMLWERFPPTTPDERRLRDRELSHYWAKQAPKQARATGDAFGEYLKRQAKEAAKLARDPGLAGRLLASSEWKARQKATYDELMSIELDLDL